MATHFNFKAPTNFNYSPAGLIRFILFAICAAGKRSDTVAPKVAAFEDIIPLTELARWAERPDVICAALQHATCKMGQYKLKTRGFIALAGQLASNPNWLSECTVEELEAIPGISQKTARFFLLHTRPAQRVLVLDTHLSKALRELDVPNIPIVDYRRPVSKRAYMLAEESFLTWADTQDWNNPADPAAMARFDIERWSAFSLSV